jgi:hypothetical protein
MSTEIARAAINTLLQYGNGSCPESFTTIPNVGSITGPGLSRTVQDVTSHSTGQPWRQKFPTLNDGGDLTFDLFYIPNDDTHKAVLAMMIDTVDPIKDWTLTFPNSDGVNFFFEGFISKMSFMEKVDDVIRANVTLTVTGVVVPNYPVV